MAKSSYKPLIFQQDLHEFIFLQGMFIQEFTKLPNFARSHGGTDLSTAMENRARLPAIPFQQYKPFVEYGRPGEVAARKCVPHFQHSRYDFISLPFKAASDTLNDWPAGEGSSKAGPMGLE